MYVRLSRVISQYQNYPNILWVKNRRAQGPGVPMHVEWVRKSDGLIQYKLWKAIVTVSSGRLPFPGAWTIKHMRQEEPKKHCIQEW